MDIIVSGKIDEILKETDKAIFASFNLVLTNDGKYTWPGSTPWPIWLDKRALDDDQLNEKGCILVRQKMESPETIKRYNDQFISVTGRNTDGTRHIK